MLRESQCRTATMPSNDAGNIDHTARHGGSALDRWRRKRLRDRNQPRCAGAQRIGPLDPPFDWLTQFHRRQPVLSVAGWLLVAAVPVLLLLAALDSRTVLNEDPWLKPLKFAISFAVYFWTLGWMLIHAPATLRAKRVIAWTNVLMFAVEATGLTIPAAQGVRSHFNTATPLYASLFYAMGVAAHVQVLSLAWLLALFFRRNQTLAPLALWGMRLGLFVVLLGFIPGDVMVALKAHTVGAPDGGPGLPLTGWSATAGDLRVAHFLGLHAMQLLPLTAFAMERWAKHLTPNRRLAWWSVLAAIYAATVTAAMIQALSGRPLLRI